MAHAYTILAGHAEVALYIISTLSGALLTNALAVLQRRGFGRGLGGGLGRRRRRGGVFGALGTLLLLMVLGPIILVALLAYVVYGMLSGRRGR